jgi:heme A synthase
LNQRNFVPFAWAVLVYNIGVILWGAFVRATGSGAGCGSHWPLCNGELIPRPEQIETIIEFSHRLTSGLALILVIVLLVWAFRAFPIGHLVRKSAVYTTLFILLEALIGAGLVLLDLVAENSSVARAFSTALHLINTFFLLGALTLTARWASQPLRLQIKGVGASAWLLGAAFFSMIVVGMSGAIAALGDTLFPISSLAEGIEQDFSPTAHFLIRLRIWHPIIAVISGLLVILATGIVTVLRMGTITRRLGQAIMLVVLVQFGVGFLNVALLAPVWMQMIHLLMADLVWILLILFIAESLGKRDVELLNREQSNSQDLVSE